ncbi:MAG: hypothetical protein O3B41_11725 [Bacteroidetes bacterium]|nr:hypothetical protein [Bacteroidota bacterium]
MSRAYVPVPVQERVRAAIENAIEEAEGLFAAAGRLYLHLPGEELDKVGPLGLSKRQYLEIDYKRVEEAREMMVWFNELRPSGSKRT